MLSRSARHININMCDADLAAEFVAEQRKRMQDEASKQEPFNGIREIVLDENGAPKAIPRRPAPPPGTSQSEEVRDLFGRPEFLAGVLVSFASLVLFLAIAAADSAANA